MTIDERLEKLTERHEALTQTVELLAREMSGMARGMSGLTRETAGLQGFVKEIAESTARLLHIAQIHEQRISKLEGSD